MVQMYVTQLSEVIADFFLAFSGFQGYRMSINQSQVLSPGWNLSNAIYLAQLGASYCYTNITACNKHS